MNYRVVALDDAIAKEVRRTMKAPEPWNHPAHLEVATGYGPCRVCLRTTRIDEERRILFTYDPFEDLDPFPLPSPIFIHEDDCQHHPEEDALPEDVTGLPLTFNGYGFGRALHAVERATDPLQVEDIIDRMLERADVDYIHVRNTEAGCYIARVEPLDDRVHRSERAVTTRC